ncbi:MAG: hypothetical protein QOI12_863 [Alphaproteobacteria bacterium]|jgi:hypothetical protein|nr:hypothetical protein [Alphaproteobacteria bacterium]
MPDIITDEELSPLAGEYVLGSLESEERTHANLLLDVDPGFRGMVRIWERRLGELHLMVEPVEPDGKVWERIKGKLLELKPGLEFPVPGVPEAAAAAEVPFEPQPEPDRDTSDLERQLAAVLESESVPAPTDGHEERAPDHVARGLGSPVLALETVPPEARSDRGEPSATAFKLDVPPAATGFKLDVPPGARPAAGKIQSGSPGTPDSLGRWRAFAALMTVVAILLGGLIAAWRFAPERLPQQLRPKVVLQLPDPPPSPRKPPAPPGSQFDE